MKKAVDDKRKICHVECQNWKTKWRWILTSLVNLSMIHLRNYYVPLRDLCPFHLCQLKVINLFKIFLKYAHVSYFHHFTNWNVQFWVDSSSGGLTRNVADLYFNISSKFKDLFCKIHLFFFSVFYHLISVATDSGPGCCFKTLETAWRSLRKLEEASRL